MTPNDELTFLIREMVDDLARGAACIARHGGSPLPFDAADLQRYSAALIAQVGVETALAEAQRRYAAQVLRDLRPLPRAGGHA